MNGMCDTHAGYRPPTVGQLVHHVVLAPADSERNSTCREAVVTAVDAADDIFVVLDSGERVMYRTPAHFGYWADDRRPGHCVGTWHLLGGVA